MSRAGDDLDADIDRWHGLLVGLLLLLAALVDDHLLVLAAKHLLAIVVWYLRTEVAHGRRHQSGGAGRRRRGRRHVAHERAGLAEGAPAVGVQKVWLAMRTQAEQSERARVLHCFCAAAAHLRCNG